MSVALRRNDPVRAIVDCWGIAGCGVALAEVAANPPTAGGGVVIGAAALPDPLMAKTRSPRSVAAGAVSGTSLVPSTATLVATDLNDRVVNCTTIAPATSTSPAATANARWSIHEANRACARRVADSG
jgi:hypothetical protein